MAFVLGVNGKAYRNTGTYVSPTWNEVDNFANGKLSLSADTVDARRRASGVFKQYAGVGVDFGASWRMLWDLADADFAAIMACYYGLTELDMIFLSGSSGSGTHQGPRFAAVFTKFEKTDDEDDIQAVDIEVKPGIGQLPTWFTGS